MNCLHDNYHCEMIASGNRYECSFCGCIVTVTPPSAETTERLRQQRLAGYTPVHTQAFSDWLNNLSYVTNDGNYHVRSAPHRRGPIAPWNKTVKRTFRDCNIFHLAAHEWAAKEESHATP